MRIEHAQVHIRTSLENNLQRVYDKITIMLTNRRDRPSQQRGCGRLSRQGRLSRRVRTNGSHMSTFCDFCRAKIFFFSLMRSRLELIRNIFYFNYRKSHFTRRKCAQWKTGIIKKKKKRKLLSDFLIHHDKHLYV